MSAPSCCDLDDFIKAMADETRQEILRLLGQRKMCVSELEALLTVHQPTVSHHLAVLRRANLVTARREGQRAYYQANTECVEGVSENDARRIAAQVMLGTAALAPETDLSWEEIKGLTPMQTVDELAVAQLFVDAARGAKAKIDGLQRKLWEAQS